RSNYEKRTSQEGWLAPLLNLIYSKALAALIRPPVTVFPFNATIGSVEAISFLRRSSTDMRGCSASTSAATPETTGVAIDVPDFSSYSLPSHVLRISTPGAATATLFTP